MIKSLLTLRSGNALVHLLAVAARSEGGGPVLDGSTIPTVLWSLEAGLLVSLLFRGERWARNSGFEDSLSRRQANNDRQRIQRRLRMRPTISKRFGTPARRCGPPRHLIEPMQHDRRPRVHCQRNEGSTGATATPYIRVDRASTRM